MSLLFFFFPNTLLLPAHFPPPLCTHAQSCNPMDCSPPGSSVHGLFQARILQWVSLLLRNKHFIMEEIYNGIPRWLSGKESTCQCRTHRRFRFDSLGQEDPLEEEMATSFSILVGKIPWIEKPGGLQFLGLQRVKT